MSESELNSDHDEDSSTEATPPAKPKAKAKRKPRSSSTSTGKAKAEPESTEQEPSVNTESAEAATSIAEADQQPDPEKERRQDNARLRRIGGLHFAATMGVLTLWGAGQTWAGASGLTIAFIASLGNSLIAGFALASMAHEWGHFSGARLAGARSPVLENPVRLFFMFNFDMKANSNDQFLSMSIGGPAANWLLVVLALILIPIGTPQGALLVATVTGIAVNVSLFEVPVILRARESHDPVKELTDQLASPGLQTLPGVIVGAIVWLALA